MDFTKDELTLIITGLDALITSAQRQQNGKAVQPMIKEVYRKQEQVLGELRLKALNIWNTPSTPNKPNK